MTSPRPEPLVRFRGVTKRWAGVTVVDDLDLVVVSGAVTVLVGPSGSGKSTVLALLGGIAAPDGGTITFAPPLDGDDRTAWSRTALCPQTLALVDELTVRENVLLPLLLAAPGASPIRSDDVLDELLGALMISDLQDRLVTEISLGQAQRTALARAAVTGPSLLLADEPTCHQDPAHSGLVVALLRRLAARGGACVVASHDPAVVDAADVVVDLAARER